MPPTRQLSLTANRLKYNQYVNCLFIEAKIAYAGYEKCILLPPVIMWEQSVSTSAIFHCVYSNVSIDLKKEKKNKRNLYDTVCVSLCVCLEIEATTLFEHKKEQSLELQLDDDSHVYTRVSTLGFILHYCKN